jgi:GT2 family glycosyltransferase
MTATVGVVVLNYNGLADTVECLQSLAALKYPRWFPVVVDNASVVDPRERLSHDFPGCVVIRSPENRGWAGGNNLGIRYCLENQADYVVLINNDTTVSSDLISRLVLAAETHREFGVLGPVIRDYQPPCAVQTEGCNFNRPDRPEFFQRVPVPLVVGEIPKVIEVDIVNGCCLMASADVFRKVGLIDERFFLIHEESDFCLRARRAGFRCGVISEALVWHKWSQSFRRTGLRHQCYYDTRNLLLLLMKHGRLRQPQRGRIRSLISYVKYAFARWEREMDAACADAAEAVVEGIVDAILRRYGSHKPGKRPLRRFVRQVFEWRRGIGRQTARVGATS